MVEQMITQTGALLVELTSTAAPRLREWMDVMRHLEPALAEY